MARKRIQERKAKMKRWSEECTMDAILIAAAIAVLIKWLFG